jgi:putative ABC transport system permease protein
MAAIGLKPWLAPGLFGAAARGADAHVTGTIGAARWLAVTRLAANPRFAGIGAAGIVASFALMVAMLTMVASFRTSVDAWLARVLPADLYVRAGPLTSAATFSAADLDRLRADPGVARVDLAHVTRVSLAPERAPVALLARVIDRARPQDTLPLTGAALPWRAGMPPPVWVSESVVDLFGARPGQPLVLPLAGRTVEVIVLGVWRDYARQFGSVLMDVNDYARLTGDATRTDASLWMAPGARAADVTARLVRQLDARSAEFAEPGEIRAISLRIFDRSFAVTYVLQIASIVIGLVGIAATFSAQAIARTREFGVLRHLGCTPRQILAVLAIEGLMVTAVAVVIGLAAGLAIAWVLVDVVNPQSFHWTMDFQLPVVRIGQLIAVLMAASTLTAVLAGRRAGAPAAVLAVREDW